MPVPTPAPSPSARRRKRTSPAWLRACYAFFIALPLAVLGAELLDVDAVVDDLPAGLLYLIAAVWIIALGVVAIDLVLDRIDARAQSRNRQH